MKLCQEVGAIATKAAISLSFVGLLGATLFSAPSQARSVPEGPPPRVPGCYRAGDQRIVFIYQKIDANGVQGALNQLRKTAQSTKGCSGSHAWDDKWYWESLPDNRDRFIGLLWKNIDSGESGFAVIQNTPAYWFVYRNDGVRETVPNGKQSKITWWTNGRRIDIDVMNPENKNGWNGNDIWYGFGY